MLPAILGSPETMDVVVARAPAEVRAQIAWLPKRFRDLFAELIAAPVLSEAVLDSAADQYLEALMRVRSVAGSLLSNADALQLVETRLTADAAPIASLAPWPRSAAMRVLATLTTVFHLSRQLLQPYDTRSLQGQLERVDFTVDAETRSMLRAIVAFFGMLEALKAPGPVPGRAAALARKSDEACQQFCEALALRDPQLRLPWYFRDAPGADRVEAFGVWRTDLLLRPSSPATAEEEESWERVKRAIDAERPHRPVFG